MHACSRFLFLGFSKQTSGYYWQKNSVEFCMLIFYLGTLRKFSLVLIVFIFLVFLFVFFFSVLTSFVSFSCFIVLHRTSSTFLTGRSDKRHFFLFPNFKRNTSVTELNRTRIKLSDAQQSQTQDIEVCNGEIKAVLFVEHQARITGSYHLKLELPDGF